MKVLYRIEFEVDNGVSYDKDQALVLAHNAEEANDKLRSLINSIDSETCVSEIYKTELFAGNVFTGRHGWRYVRNY
jgi:hypothetical protein